jgi:thiamine pyrophosphokinase
VASTLIIAASLDATEHAFYAGLMADAASVVAVDAGLHACRWAERPPDLLIGDLDSVDKAVLAWLDDHDTTVVTAETRKDETDLELALDHISGEGVPSLTVTGVIGGRLDHELAALSALFRADTASITIREPHLTAWVIKAPFELSVSGAPGSTVSLLAWGGESVVSTVGLEYPLVDEALANLEPRAVSNRLLGETAQVTLSEGELLVVMPVLDFPPPIGYATASPER